MSFLLSAALLAAFVAEPEPNANETELSLNLSLVSEYRYRGISQSRLKPAIQGGADFTNKANGLYAGAWSSTIRWTKDAGGGGNSELDLYGGKRGNLSAGLTYDVGALSYVYAGNGLAKVAGSANANTTEVYGQLGYGTVALKYSQAVTNLFGFADSRGSSYLDLSANPELGSGWSLNLHAGHQRVAHNGAASYADWKVGVTKDLSGPTLSLAWIDTNASRAAYTSVAGGKFLGDGRLVLNLTKTF
ncbi:TorF family putative porin [Massilia sp. TS11]|uniref:TorF family putative porin n=1 Tax=Massilia sp. TS11 TaxID=2908003 RepID=UPI001EDBDBB5|nr:TorF family putative porin [Massilia sp. TS11]MCG2584357.1 TorF family putative porin [Massilia sp. TS11]